MDVLTSIKGQSGLPRYFASAFAVLKGMGRGRLDFVLPDGRRILVLDADESIMSGGEALKALAQGRPVAWITHAGVTRCVAWLSNHGGKLPLSHQWPLEAPGWGDWVMVRPGLTGEAPVQQT